MEKKFENVYQFKIVLEESKPMIWRRVLVPETYTFWDLHVTIQDAMGWENYHMHEFEAVNHSTEEIITIKTPEWEQLIADFLDMDNPLAHYIYDFGDSWGHIIELENIVPVEKDVNYPICINGKGACPPEDCGGVWGYEELLEIIKNPDHEEYEEMLEWVEENFDPEYFDPKKVVFSDPTDHMNDLLNFDENY